MADLITQAIKRNWQWFGQVWYVGGGLVAEMPAKTRDQAWGNAIFMYDGLMRARDIKDLHDTQEDALR